MRKGVIVGRRIILMSLLAFGCLLNVVLYVHAIYQKLNKLHILIDSINMFSNNKKIR